MLQSVNLVDDLRRIAIYYLKRRPCDISAPARPTNVAKYDGPDDRGILSGRQKRRGLETQTGLITPNKCIAEAKVVGMVGDTPNPDLSVAYDSIEGTTIDILIPTVVKRG